MKKIILPALFFAGWMSLMNTDIPAKGSFLPALGRFLNPFCGIWQNVVPRLTPEMMQSGISSRVKILFDARDIPHIYAANLTDAVYAQGYLHAFNRLFAMEVTTRDAAGRLSELIGSKTLARDRKQRERGFEYSAIQKAASWNRHPEDKALIDAYVQGVNDFIHSLRYKQWPVEYKILSHAPGEWSDVKSALTATSMAISLCLGENDLEYSEAMAKLTPADFQFLYPAYNVKESPVIPKEKSWDFTSSSSDDSSEPIKSDFGYQAEKTERDLNGSNNWALGPGRTAHGFPLLANDPHLGLTLPNIWYEMEIHTPQVHVHGVSLPGLPMIIIGFNDRVAWGLTNSGQDVLDWYKITWQDSSRKKYVVDGKPMDAVLRPEVIDIRGAASIIDTIRYTHWGPVSHIDAHKDMAMKWIGHARDTTDDVAYLKEINEAHDLTTYRHAVSNLQYPAQNIVFASVDGDIALTVSGVMPKRPKGEGESVTPGDKNANDWQGFIPFAQAPYIINPKRGFVSSANQAPADTTYPYPLLGRRIFEDYRGREINMVLDSAKGWTPEDMEALQQNNFNLHAAELLPLLLDQLKKTGCVPSAHQHYVDLLAHWNEQYHRDSIGPVLFEIWYDALQKRTWDELDTLKLMRPEDWRFVEIIRDHPDNNYFDLQATPDKKETAADIICMSFEDMVRQYESLPADQQKNWGQYKQSAIPHLARLPHFGIDFISASGGKHIINAMNKSHGPSWRMVVEMSSPPKAWVNYPGGQSGDPASPHFKDFVDDFFAGHYYPILLQHDPAAWTPSRTMTIDPR